jgi:nicotinamide riboside kinase
VQQFDLLFLCKPDIPWEFDILRENPINRDELFDLYHSFLIENKQNFVVVEGNEQQRLSIVKTAIATLLKN